MSLKEQVRADMQAALRGGEKRRLGTLRLLLAAIQQRELEERCELTDSAVLQVTQKLIKQRRAAAAQFADAGRAELQAQELAEAEILAAYLPAPLSEAELDSLIKEMIQATGATSMRDMGKVIAGIRERAQGRVDMGLVSQRVKARLAG
jgi:uncharacterized protein YqeY